VLAASYAGYLNPDLEIEVLQVWLRFRAGDPHLADEILERASDEANRWVAARAEGRVQRRRFTDVLKIHGVVDNGYGIVTNALYRALFNKSANQIKAERRVVTTRDGFEITELAQVTLSEGLASERIEDEKCWGANECARATSTSASYIRDAVEAERRSRQAKRLV